VISAEGTREERKDTNTRRGSLKQPEDDEGWPSGAPPVGVTGKGIRASPEIRLRLGSKYLRFGLCSKGAPTWSWFVGASGSVEWIVGDKDLPMRNVRDPEFVDIKDADLPQLGEVDVVLFQGFRPGMTHEVWDKAGVGASVWCSRGLRAKERLPRGWSLTTKVM
jgi:hypothetical protein